MRKILGVLFAIVIVGNASVTAGEIGFIEDFSLAPDRRVPLKQLIPGTPDYYYYNCLHLQNQGKLAAVEKLLGQWLARHRNHTPRVWEIKNRQALLLYEKNPRKSLAYIQKRLGIYFHHQKDQLRQVNHASSLNPQTLTRATLKQRALRSYNQNTLGGFESRAMDWLIQENLTPKLRRHLLSRLRRPDYPNLPRLIVDDLNQQYSGGFGSHPIHRLLLKNQLEEILRLKPDLRNNRNFIQVALARLKPPAGIDWRHDPAARTAYLDRQWAFVSGLNGTHNSLKVNVLYHRLVHDRALGIFNQERFMTYLRLPRNVNYINQNFIRQEINRRHRANLRQDFQRYTQLPPVQTDEPLVRSLLATVFLKADNFNAYKPYISEHYLREVFAETKILNGIGDMEKWYSMLNNPAKYQQIKDRIDIDFAYTNKRYFTAPDAVSLDLYTKNIKTLLVKVFDVNAFNYYRDTGREITTNINLDGLVANEEKTYTYTETPFRRVKRNFTFPTLNKAGVYVIEFIGNGQSSRAVIRKGRLRFLDRLSVAGHVLTILSENNQPVKDATVWLSGREYKPEADGSITIPYSEKPGRQSIIIRRGSLTTLDSFQHERESYQLQAGIHVDRESLRKGGKATVLVRPALRINGIPAPLALLEEVTLSITSRDRDGVQSTKKIRGFKLSADQDTPFEFAVPDKLTQLSFSLQAKVQPLSRTKKETLNSQQSFSLNQMDQTSKVEDLHLSRTAAGYVVHLLGKNGEARAKRPVYFTFKHRDFTQAVTLWLQTNEQGQISLGALRDIQWLTVRGPEGTQHRWFPTREQHSRPNTIHGKTGVPISIPYLGSAIKGKPARSEFSLIELRAGQFFRDRFAALTVENGSLVLRDLPTGDYSLLLKDERHTITLRVTAGIVASGYILAANRQLEISNPAPLHIERIAADEKTITIQIQNADTDTRVHVYATNFVPAYSPYTNLDRPSLPEPVMIEIEKGDSQFLTGRNIGDEYRYILERRLAKKFPGNMLARPGLLLNPWAVRNTAAAEHRGRQGGQYGNRGRGGRRKTMRSGGGSMATRGGGNVFANLDFLAAGSAIRLNLKPDKDGRITIKRADLGGKQQIHVIAIDHANTVYRTLALPAAPLKTRDLRLTKGLDPQKHYAEQKRISVLTPGKPLVITDASTAKLEGYDTLAKVYRLFRTISGDSRLDEFSFILRWPTLKDAEKLEKYSRYACHELNFFLYKKDPKFFAKIIKPYLQNKKAKTFMDHYLLGNDLADYRQPWQHTRLNMAEQVFLAQRIQGESSYTARNIRDVYELTPPNIELFNHLFKTALRGSALDLGKDGNISIILADGAVEGDDDSVADGPSVASSPPASRSVGYARDKYARYKKGKSKNGKARSMKPDLAPRQEEVEMEELMELSAKKPQRTRREARDKEITQVHLKKSTRLDVQYEALRGELKDDMKRRQRVRRLFQKLEKTQEWAENNYWHLPIEQQNATLIPVSAFWRDYAEHDNKSPFLSANLAEAGRNFAEMMLALAVLDLPFEAKKHTVVAANNSLTITAGSPSVLFHKEIQPAGAQQASPVLVSQHFFKLGDRYRHEQGERLDKYVTDEFLPHTVYGCQVVLTNPSSAQQKIDVLLQIPVGAVPVQRGFETKSQYIRLAAHGTQTFEYHFYFPNPGKAAHFPVHVSKNGALIAFAKPVVLNVVKKLSKIDTESWDYLSQRGTSKNALDYLTQKNLHRIDLARIAWRMRDKEFYTRAIAILEARHAWNMTLWSYAIAHNDTPRIREYLQHRDDFLRQCGAYIDTPLVRIDPVERRAYQHLEYSPLVNPRVHRFGARRKILNGTLYSQYHRLMNILSYHNRLGDNERMVVVYYLLLQDRIEDALRFFKDIDRRKLPAKIQYDYLKAYLAFYQEDAAGAAEIATKYKTYPVDRWRKRFANILSQVAEIEGKGTQVTDNQDRTQQQDKLAATQPGFDFKVESRKIAINYQNMSAVTVNYYKMDIELLFSRNPFVQQQSGQFAYIRPNRTDTIALPKNKRAFTFDLPKEFHSANVMVEIVGEGQKKTQAYYANTLAVQVIGAYGQVRVTHRETGKALSKVYVKVFARNASGRAIFYKDGYTDLRGRFDYASLNSNAVDVASRFAILILSEKHGALVREASPPKR